MIGRRSFLTASLGALASVRSWGQEPPPLRPVKSVIWAWMEGGASQIDTWDPKPGHPNSAGLRAIDTRVPGISLSELMPRCAAQMDKLSILRTAQLPRGFGDPSSAWLSDAMHCSLPPGCDEVEPATGTLFALELANREAPVPAFVSIDSPRIPEAGYFQQAYIPYHVSSVDEDPSSRPADPSATELAREALLSAQNREWEASRQTKFLRSYQEARLRRDVLRSRRFRGALETEGEPASLRQEYGAGFGRRCLQARRLVEAGVAVVEIAQTGWEQAARSFEAIRRLGEELDRGIGTLVRDLEEHGLLQDTVLVCIGPGGRSPGLNTDGGRDGGTSPFSVALAGGSLKGGRVFGDTGPGGTQATPPVPYWDLHATLFRACGVNPNKTYFTGGHRMKYVSRGSPGTSGTPISQFF